MVFRRPIYNEILTDTEYETNYHKLNTPESLVKYVGKDCFMMRANNKLIESHHELKDITSENNKVFVYFSVEFLRLKYLSVIRLKKNKFKEVRWFQSSAFETYSDNSI